MAGRSDRTPTMYGWGLQLYLFREDKKWSRGVLADVINTKAAELKLNVCLGERLIARWENGEVRKPGSAYRQLLSAIGAPIPVSRGVPESAMGSSCVVPLAHQPALPTVVEEAEVDDMRRRNFLSAIGAAVVGSTAGLVPWLPPRATPTAPDSDVAEFTDITYLVEVTDSLRRLDAKHGGRAIIATAHSLFHTYQGYYPDDLQAATGLADLAGLIGWAWHDVGNQHRARAYLAQGIVYARSVDAHSQVASLLYRLGRVSLFEKHPRDALRMFQLGQIPAGDAHSLPDKARLLTNEAWAWAMLGEERQMLDSLSRAEHELSLVNVGDINPWNRDFFTPGDYHGHKSVISNELALAVDNAATAERYTMIAAEAAQKSITCAGPDRSPRSALFDHIMLAGASMRLGEASIGTDAAWKAIRLSGPIRSARAKDRFNGLLIAAEPLMSRSDVRDVHHAISRKQLALTAGVE